MKFYATNDLFNDEDFCKLLNNIGVKAYPGTNNGQAGLWYDYDKFITIKTYNMPNLIYLNREYMLNQLKFE